MVRTKQTARRSSGIRVPRRQLATRARSRFDYSDSDGESTESNNQSLLVEIYNNGGARTIAVDGEDEFEVDPDIVRLSFKISEEHTDVQEAINNALSKLGEARQKFVEIGILNENISSDSLCVSERVKAEVSPSGPGKRKREVNIVTFTAIIILRLRLENDTMELFGRTMFSAMEMGLYSQKAPVYELSELTAHRNEARTNAIVNAREKAEVMLTGFGTPNISLEYPITINDIPVDISDDSASAFFGNSRPFLFAITKKEDASDDDDDSVEKVSRPRLEKLKDRMNDLFVAPPIRVSAKVRVIFALRIDEERKVGEEEKTSR